MCDVLIIRGKLTFDNSMLAVPKVPLALGFVLIIKGTKPSRCERIGTYAASATRR